MTIQKKYRLDTVGRIFYIRNQDSVLINPTSLTVVVADSAGTTITTVVAGGTPPADATLINIATGTYRLLFNISATAVYGTWTMKVTAVYTESGVLTKTNTEDFAFEIIEHQV